MPEACDGDPCRIHAWALAQSLAWTWLTTVDHKRIGILYSTTAFAFFLLAGIESLAMRVQLARPDSTLIGARTYSELL